MQETHELRFERMCPVTHNPGLGSTLSITYSPNALILEVASLRAYVDSYRGGRGDVRSMEGMVQQICRDCCMVVGVKVSVIATLLIEPRQKMTLNCAEYPPQ